MIAVTRVHTYPDLLRFQKFPLWRPFSKVCGYGRRFHQIRIDAKRNRNLMFADTNESGYVWTGPQQNTQSLTKNTTGNNSIVDILRKKLIPSLKLSPLSPVSSSGQAN